MAVARDNAKFGVTRIWPWREWPGRERLTGLDGRDHGIDLVAVQTDVTRVAIQCKCLCGARRPGKATIDSFLNESACPVFDLRWIVSTCACNSAAECAIVGREPWVAATSIPSLSLPDA